MFCDTHDFPDFHRLRHFAMGGRRRGGWQGFGPFAAAGGPFAGGGPFRMGRMFGAADLQLLILALLADKPRHGYELIKAFEEHSNGFYTPSPGMIYPALAYLEELGYATAEAEGTKKLYSITDAGREHLNANRAAVDKTFENLRKIGEKMEHFRGMFTGEGPHTQQGGDKDEEEFSFRNFSSEMKEARHNLKAALRQKRGSSIEEAKRIADILRRAAAEIANPPRQV